MCEGVKTHSSQLIGVLCGLLEISTHSVLTSRLVSDKIFVETIEPLKLIGWEDFVVAATKVRDPGGS